MEEPELFEEMKKQNSKFKFLDIPDFFKVEESNKIDKTRLVSKIYEIDPQIIFMVICYSEINDLRFLLEGSGLFAEMRMNRDLNILSKGHFLTMNDTQKRFIQTLAHEDHIKKDVILTGSVGSGKTVLGLEAINIKKSHYKKKYRISACQKKLRVIILIGSSDHGSQLKKQLKMSESHKVCSLDIHSEIEADSTALTRIFQADENYKSYFHTIIMIDEGDR